MLTSDFDYDLPAELIAQEPPAERTDARMLVVDRAAGTLTHAGVRDLPNWLRAGDLAVLNDTRVFPARIQGRWADSGGQVELLLVEPADGAGGPAGSPAIEATRWECLCGSGRRARVGQRAIFAEGTLLAELLQVQGGGRVTVQFVSEQPLMALLEAHGGTPVPPYIRRTAADGRQTLDRARYQTVYAARTGAVAAPTAGLHFNAELLARLTAGGIAQAFVTLHVGPGTFQPVQSETVEAHRIAPERYDVPAATAEAVAACRARGGRILAVGSTSVRALESMARLPGAPCACSGRSDLFIHPPFRFACTDRMLTNFHLPRSSLLMMVAALAGHERIMAAYREAVRARYRFYSYGDCMLIV